MEAVDLEELLDSLEESPDASEEGVLLPVLGDLVRRVHEVVLLHGLVLQDQLVCRLLHLILFLQNKNTFLLLNEPISMALFFYISVLKANNNTPSRFYVYCGKQKPASCSASIYYILTQAKLKDDWLNWLLFPVFSAH